MAAEEVDVVVLGMGPGGESAGAELARAGLDVVGVESRLVGGECPYYACIPTKMMVRASNVLAESRRVPSLAGNTDVSPDWTPVAERIAGEATSNWDDHSAVERFESSGGRFVRGLGRMTDSGEITVSTMEGERIFHPRRGILLNPGTKPVAPAIDGLAGTPYWTNREAVAAREVPRSLLVLGGGPVGLEFTQVFSRFGSAVRLIEAGPRVLANVEPEAAQTITDTLRADGVDVRTNASVRRVNHDAEGFAVELADEVFRVEQMLVATGRQTDLGLLGVTNVGLDARARTIPVDSRMRAADGVWAIGDVTGVGAFTHTSVYQARIAAQDILGQNGETADYRAMPSVTFTDPEVATVGQTEADARGNGVRVRTGIADIPNSPRGWIHQAGNDGLIKLVVDADRDVLVGATVVAAFGGEIVGALAVAVHGEVPVTSLRRMIFAYPTFHRAIEAALSELDT